MVIFLNKFIICFPTILISYFIFKCSKLEITIFFLSTSSLISIDIFLAKSSAELTLHNSPISLELIISDGPSLLVQANIEKAPLEITDTDVFSEVIQALIGGKGVTLDITAAVDVGVDTPVGKFDVREIPAQGVVPIKRL